MAWNYDDEEINGIVDANLKDSPPNPPAVNTAATVRSLLKSYWAAIRGQVSGAVNGVDLFIATTLATINEQLNDTLEAVDNTLSGVNASLATTLQTVETRTAAAEAKADSIYEQFSLADGLGTVNAATNIATIKETAANVTLTSVASQPNGKYFDITVAGTTSITGTATAVLVGGRMVSRGTKWDYIPPADTGFLKSIENELKIDAPKILENLVPNSSNLLAWGKVGSTTTAASDFVGLSYAVKITDTNANSVHQIGSSNINLVAGVVTAFSVFIEAGTKTRVHLSLGNAAAWPGGVNPPSLIFDLVTGTFSSIPVSVGVAKAVKIGNIYRILFTSISHLTGTTVFRIGMTEANSGGATFNTIFTGTGTDYIYASFPQVTQSSDFAPYSYNNTTQPIVKSQLVAITQAEKTSFEEKLSQSQVEYVIANKFITGDVVENTLINNTSFNVESNSGSASSGYISVSPGDVLVFSGFTNVGKSVQFSDANKVKLVATPGLNFSSLPQSITIPANCRFIRFTIKRSTDAANDYANIHVDKRTLKSVLNAQIDLSSLDLLGVRVTTNEADIVLLKANTPTGTLDFEVIAPEVVYVSDGSTNFNGRREPTKVYLSHFIRERIEISLNKGANDYILNRDILNTSDVNDYVVPLTIGGGRYVTKDISIPVKSIRPSVLAGQMIKLLYNGDSITAPQMRNGAVIGAGSIWDMCLEISAKNKVDNGNVGYNMIGIGRSLPNNIVNKTAPYKGSTVTIKGGAEGYGGWSAHNWLRHPFRLTTTDPNARQGGWDLLGLKAQTGVDFTNTWANNKLLADTCYGVNAPVISSFSYETLRGQGEISTGLGTWTGSGTQIAAVQAWIDSVAENPRNPFFDITKTGSNRFSYAKYLERYQTLDEDGLTRRVVGLTAGSKVTNATAYDVCTPTHVIICLGENDRNSFNNEPTPSDKWNKVADDILELAGEYRTQIPSCFVGVCLTDRPGSMFPERTPDYKGELYGTYIAERAKKWDLYKVFVSRLGNLATQVAAKTWLIPTWHVMQPCSHNNTSFQIDEGTGKEIQIANSDMTHPGVYGMRSAAVPVYAWIAYTKTLP